MDALDLNDIRNQTRLALPDDNGYLFRLGIAIYGFASLSSFMAEVACLLDGTVTRAELEAKTGGEILNCFRQSLKLAKKNNRKLGLPGQAAADLFEKLNSERSDFVHSYPITNKSNAQILHRRYDGKGKLFEVTNEFLDSFISRLADVSSKLYEVRAAATPSI